MHVLDFHRSVVHQNSDRQSHAAERHYIDGLPEEAEHDEGSQDGKRYRQAHNQGAAPASQEQQDHQRRQGRRNGCFADHAAHRRAHEQRLIEELRDLQIRRQSSGDPRQQSLDPVDD